MAYFITEGAAPGVSLGASMVTRRAKPLKQLKAMFLVPLLAAGCGSSPAAPSATPTPAAAPQGLSMMLMVAPSGVGGFTAPTSLTFEIQSRGTPVRIATASYRMLDGQGQLLAEAFFDSANAPNSDPNRSVSEGKIVQTLSWPAERGKGAKLDVVVTYPDAAGVLSTHSFSIPAQ